MAKTPIPASFGFAHNGGGQTQFGGQRRTGGRPAPRRGEPRPQQEAQPEPVNHLPEPDEKNYNRMPEPQAPVRRQRPAQGQERPRSDGQRRGPSGPARQGTFNRGPGGPARPEQRRDGRPGYGARPTAGRPGPRNSQGRPEQRRDGRPRYGARPAGDRPGPNRYGVDPSRHSGIVSPSPYFDEPRREPYRPSRQEAPRREAPKAPQEGSWFSKFLKKKKADYKNE